jgi:hypothetical protein
MNVIK